MKTYYLIIFLVLSMFKVFSQDALESGFKPFPIEGGYGPGSFVVIRRDYVSSPIISRTQLLKVITDKSILDLTKPTNLPTYEYDRTKVFKSGLEVKSDYENLPGSIKSNLNKIKEVKLIVSKGSRYSFNSGSIAFDYAIRAMPYGELIILRDAIKRYKNVFMITEVTVYDSATAIFKWGLDFDTEAKAKIINAIKIKGSAKWLDDGNLSIQYKDTMIAGYKSIPISRKDFSAIKALIEDKLKNSVGEATLESTKMQSKLTSSRVVKSEIVNTEDLHEKDCDYKKECTCLDEKYCGFEYKLSVSAQSPNGRLTNPSIECQRENSGSCVWNEAANLNRGSIDYSANRETITFRRVVGSRSIGLRLWATEEIYTMVPDPPAFKIWTLKNGGTILVEVENDTQGIIRVNWHSGQKEAIELGKSSKNFLLIDSIKKGDKSLFTYKVSI